MKFEQILEAITSDSGSFIDAEMDPHEALASIEQKIKAHEYKLAKYKNKMGTILNALRKEQLAGYSWDTFITGIPADQVVHFKNSNISLLVRPTTAHMVPALKKMDQSIEDTSALNKKLAGRRSRAKSAITKQTLSSAAAGKQVKLTADQIPRTVDIGPNKTITNPYFRFSFNRYAGSPGHFDFGPYRSQYANLSAILSRNGLGGFDVVYASSGDTSGSPMFVATAAKGQIAWYVFIPKGSTSGKRVSYLYPMTTNVKYLLRDPIKDQDDVFASIKP